MTADDGRGRGEPSAGAPADLLADDLTSQLGALARELAAHQGTDAIVRTVVEAAVTDVPGADHASISVATKHRGETLAATSGTARRVDELQYRFAEGPCLDTLFEHVTVRAARLETESRWPRFGSAAAEEGVHSMLSVQLFTDGRNLGALNLFGERAASFTDESELAALALAAHAAVAVAASQQIQDLQRALASRDLIGQAKGILMERHRIDDATAFAVLVRYSRDTNVKLVTIADDVVHGRRTRP